MKKAALLALSTLVIVMTVRAAEQSDPPKELPSPPEIDRFHELMKQIERTSRLTPNEKEAVKAQAVKVEAQFDRVWQPLKDSYDELRETTETMTSEGEAIGRKIDDHNAHPPDSKNEAAVNAYNQKADRLNAEKKEWKERYDRENNRLVQQMQDRANQVDKWLAGPELKDFMDKAKGLLTGRLRFTKGLAWDQLQYVSGGGSSPEFGDAGGNSVDPRGVRPLTPEERQTIWKQPSHQMPRSSRRKTTVPPAPKPKP